MSQPTVIDSLVFARSGGLLQGELPVASFTRALDMLADPSGALAYRVTGQMGPRGRPRLILEVDGVLSVRCQRCLEGITYPLGICSSLELVGNEEELTQEEIEDDSMDFLPAQKELDVAVLIEDEILLDLPVAPRHENCALPGAGGPSQQVSPFSALEALKGKAR